jgi:hypothetical protein
MSTLLIQATNYINNISENNRYKKLLKDGKIFKADQKHLLLKKRLVAGAIGSSATVFGLSSIGMMDTATIGAEFSKDILNLWKHSTDKEAGENLIKASVISISVLALTAQGLMNSDERQNRRTFQNTILKDFNLPLNLPDAYNNNVTENEDFGFTANLFFAKMFEMDKKDINKHTKEALVEISKRKWVSKLPNLIKKHLIKNKTSDLLELVNDKSISSAIYQSYLESLEGNNKDFNKLIKNIKDGDESAIASDDHKLMIDEISNINEKAIINASFLILKQNIKLNYISSLKQFCTLYNNESNNKGIVDNPSQQLRKMDTHLRQFQELEKVTTTSSGKSMFSKEENEFFQNPFGLKSKKLDTYIDGKLHHKIKTVANESLKATIKKVAPNFINSKGKFQIILFADAYKYQFDSIVKAQNISGNAYRDFENDYKRKDEQIRKTRPDNNIVVSSLEFDEIFASQKKSAIKLEQEELKNYKLKHKSKLI